MDYKNILLKLLEAIDFAEDKEAFVTEFIKLTELQAMSDLFTSQTQETQQKITQELTAEKDNHEKVEEIIKKYFSEEQLTNAFQNAAQKGVTQWMLAIEPTLSVDQKQKIASFTEELTKSQ